MRKSLNPIALGRTASPAPCGWPNLLPGILLAFAISGTSGHAIEVDFVEKELVDPIAPIQAGPFLEREVRLLSGEFHDAMMRDAEYLLSLDPERLLHTFRLNVGLASNAEPLGGWEAPEVELRGHTLGHYLAASSLIYAKLADARLRVRTAGVVLALERCQQAAASRGYHDGYLSAFPESFFDRLDRGEPVWAPWYTIHKLMDGLLNVYWHCDNPRAMTVLKGMAQWIGYRLDRVSPEVWQRSLDTEFGGMGEVLANLYAVTADPEHLRLARAFDHEAFLAPLARGEDRLDGLHANTQIPKIIAAARTYEITGENRYRDIARFFWERVALRRSYAIGGHSDREHFFPVAEFDDHLGAATAETCNTHNLLELTRHLFAWEPSSRLMDFYERAVYNHILASQDPATGMMGYFASLKPGHFKTYCTPLDSFWCCVGTGMENHARYTEAIYFHGQDTLYVNLFIPSLLRWGAKDVEVMQRTGFPDDDLVTLQIRCRNPTALTLKIRQPYWATAPLVLAINGKREATVVTPDGYVTIDRTWRMGDVVALRLPLGLRLEPLPASPARVAVLYGPLVLAGMLGTEGLEGVEPYVEKQLDLADLATPEVPVFVSDPEKVLKRIVPVRKQLLTFRTKGIGKPRDVELIPYYRLHHQRFNVYWRVLDKAQWRELEATRSGANRPR